MRRISFLVERPFQLRPKSLVLSQPSAWHVWQTSRPTRSCQSASEIANSLRTSVATDLSSAPVVLGHRRAIRSKRISRSTLMLRRLTVSTVVHYRHIKSITFGRESVGYVPFPRCRAKRTPPCDPIVQAAVARDPRYQVCTPRIYY